jgi:hypothetical protein
MPHVRDDVRSHRSRWQYTGRLQPHVRPISRAAMLSTFAGGMNSSNGWGPAIVARQLCGVKDLPDSSALPTMAPGDDRAPHHHQDTHHHHYYAASQAAGLTQLALPALPALPLGQPALSRSGGCLVTFLVLLGAFLTFMVLLMGLALAGHMLALQ